MGFWTGLGLLIKLYWPTAFIVLYPLLLLPIILTNNTAAMRCLYLMLLMIGFWITEVFPLGITGLIPTVLLPIFGIMGSKEVSVFYFLDANILYLSSLSVAAIIEHSNLHYRISLNIIKRVGCGFRKLNLSIFLISYLLSMWISNTAATAMLVPIVTAISTELESQGLYQMYEEPQESDERPRPSDITKANFLAVAYASSIGGVATLLGSGTNKIFKGLYAVKFPSAPQINFIKWLITTMPVSIVILILTWVWFQVWFMGLGRRNSKDAQAITLSDEEKIKVKELITLKLEELGPMSFHEFASTIVFALTVLMLIFREPEFMPGWESQLANTELSDATPLTMIVLLMFLIPKSPDFINFFRNDKEKYPKKNSEGLITWKYIQKSLNYGLIFMWGGGFVLAEATRKSELDRLIANKFRYLSGTMPAFQLFITSFLASIMTQFISNMTSINILIPVTSEIAVNSKLNPNFLLLPVLVNCSFAFLLPISTPPNAIAASACHISSWEMIKAGWVVVLISLLVVYSTFPFLIPLIWGGYEIPDWAKNKAT